MEAFFVDNNDDEDMQVRVDFCKFIRNIELNCAQASLNRKCKALVKQRLKEEWINRTKIIPPALIRPSYHQNSRICFKKPSLCSQSSMNENYKMEDESLIEKKVQSQRKIYNKSCRGLRNIASCGQVRMNWRVEFRKDELNFLKYSTAKTRYQTLETDNNRCKLFKVRKIYKKFEQLKTETIKYVPAQCAENETQMLNKASIQ